MRRGQFAQRLHEFKQARLDRTAIPEAGAVLQVNAIGRRVLADDQQFLHAAFEQRARLLQHIANGAAHQIAPHRRDDAEGAAVIAALADLQVGVMARRQLQPRLAERARHQVEKRIVPLGQVRVHRVHHLLRGVRARDGQHRRVQVLDQVF